VGQYAVELGFDAQRLHLVPNGHYIAPYQQEFDRAALRAEYRVGPRDKFLLSVGRVIPTKRMNDLVAALRIVRQRYPQWRLVIVGDGPLVEQLQGQIAEAGLSDEIFLAGRGRNLVPLLKSADLFVFPSEVEGLPNAVIEAGLAGLPIIACDAPGVRDVIEHEQTGLLVPTRNPAALAAAIMDLFEHPDKAQRLATLAREQMIAQYSTESSLESLYRAYELALKQVAASDVAAAKV
jgi:glycosyltransferase involved in cell wall biosynthesis